MASWTSPKRESVDIRPVIRLFGGLLDTLKEENVISGRDLNRLGESLCQVVTRTANMVRDITDKSEEAKKIVKDHLSKPKEQQRLQPALEICDAEDITSELSLSSSESEKKKEKDKTEENVELAETSIVPLSAWKLSQKDSVDKMSKVAMDTFGDILSDFKEKNVINGQDLRSLGEEAFCIVASTVNLVKDITKKSEKAGKIFRNHLSKPGEQLSLITLEDSAELEESDEFTGTLKLCPREEFLRRKEEMAEKIYPIRERNERTRQALIICNIVFDSLSKRNGADVDIERMTSLLESLDYKVKVEKQLTAKEMQSVLQTFAHLPEHETSDSTFLVFMSHGILEGICGTAHSTEQYDVLPYHTIFEIFNNFNCESLKDKPKIIIVQACRGGNSGELYSTDTLWTSANMFPCLPWNVQFDSIQLNHLEKDFIAFYSTTPHNMSPRHELEGSPFITQLITCIQKYSWRYHLEEVFREVQRLFEKPYVRAQMPTMDRVSMSRYFYLFPGN